MNVRLDFPDELVEAIAARVAEMVGIGKVSPLMTVTEAAEYLRCEPKRIYDLTSQRRIDFSKDGSRTLVRREALDRYLADESEKT
jgi:excisionase family DNA binding protein